MKLEVSIDISAPPESIWPVITRRENVFKVDRLIKNFEFVRRTLFPTRSVHATLV